MKPSSLAVQNTSIDAPHRQVAAKRIWMLGGLLALAAALVVLTYLAIQNRQPATVQATSSVVQPVLVAGPGLITIAPDSKIWSSLEIAELKREVVKTPLLQVTGFTLGRIRPGNESLADRWQFNSSELSNTYTDWLRSETEVRFAKDQLEKTKKLAEADQQYLAAVVKRQEPIAGSAIPESDFLRSKSQLLKAQLQGDKDIFEAQLAVQTALNRKGALERDLSRAGIEQGVFSKTVENMVLVVASVPEIRIADTKVGQACQVRIFAYPKRLFPAHVESLSSLISQDRQTLRVLFELNDEEGILKPGMFCDVGLGTDPRESLLIPDTAVLHLGGVHYLIVETEDGWRATQVEFGEEYMGEREVIRGVEAGARILTKGVVLLKPVVMQSLAIEDEGSIP